MREARLTNLTSLGIPHDQRFWWFHAAAGAPPGSAELPMPPTRGASRAALLRGNNAFTIS